MPEQQGPLEGSQAVPVPTSSSPGPGTSEGPVLSPCLPGQRRLHGEGSLTGAGHAVSVSAPCLVFCTIQDPLPLGQVGEAERPSRMWSGSSSFLSASGTVTAPNLLGPRLGTDPTTEIWLFKSEI